MPHRVSAGTFVIVSLLALAIGCDDEAVVSGPPELHNFFVVQPGQAPIDLLVPPDGGAGPILPQANFRAVFTRLLAGDKIEDLDVDGPPAPRPDVVTFAWTHTPEQIAGPPSVPILTGYDPGGVLNMGPGPSLLINPAQGLPSGAVLQIQLNPDRITGKDGTPFEGPRMLVVETIPFAVTFNLGEIAVSSVFELKVSFNNTPAPDVLAAISVVQEDSGLAVDLKIQSNAENPNGFIITPVAGGWVQGRYRVTVAASAADHFGVTLGTAATALMMVGTPIDASDLMPSVDAGVADAGVQDAAGDVSAGH